MGEGRVRIRVRVRVRVGVGVGVGFRVRVNAIAPGRRTLARLPLIAECRVQGGAHHLLLVRTPLGRVDRAHLGRVGARGRGRGRFRSTLGLELGLGLVVRVG